MTTVARSLAVRRHGFTLVELLVVVAVLALLAALLLPVLAGVRERGSRATCASNLRQIGIALQAYVDDHDGAYPVSPLDVREGRDTEEDRADEDDGSGDWEEVILPYLRSEPIYRCPSDRSPVEFFEVSYALNASFASGLRASAVTYPAGTIVAADRRSTLLNQDRPALFVWWLWQGNHWPPSDRPDPTPAAGRDLALERHGDRLNFLFGDGHVRAVRFQETWGAGHSNQYWPQRP